MRRGVQPAGAGGPARVEVEIERREEVGDDVVRAPVAIDEHPEVVAPEDPLEPGEPAVVVVLDATATR